MKKIFITLLILSGFYSFAFAQKGQQSNFEFGVNIGYNSSYVQQSNSYFTSDLIGGLNLGVSADYYFSDRWSLKAKLIYDQKGWGNGYLIDNNGNETDGVDYKLDYFTIPVMANWHFGRNYNWYLDFGPYIGFLSSAKVTDGASSLDVTSQFNSTDAGVALGIGVKFPISPKNNLFIEYEGEGGLANVITNADYNSNFQNVRESINVGINF